MPLPTMVLSIRRAISQAKSELRQKTKQIVSILRLLHKITGKLATRIIENGQRAL